MPQVALYNPEEWLRSTTRALKEYALSNLTNVYDVIMEFPSTDRIVHYIPLETTLIHFEIDAIDDHLIGFGEVIGLYNYDIPGEFVRPQEARMHRINFDIGVWSSDRSGGTTSRLRAREYLTNMFKGAQAQRQLNRAVDGGDGTIEIINFTGGRFVTDKINDVSVYRTVDSQLEVRVFSRTPPPGSIETIEEILQEGSLDVPE